MIELKILLKEDDSNVSFVNNRIIVINFLLNNDICNMFFEKFGVL